MENLSDVCTVEALWRHGPAGLRSRRPSVCLSHRRVFMSSSDDFIVSPQVLFQNILLLHTHTHTPTHRRCLPSPFHTPTVISATAQCCDTRPSGFLSRRFSSVAPTAPPLALCKQISATFTQKQSRRGHVTVEFHLIRPLPMTGGFGPVGVAGSHG